MESPDIQPGSEQRQAEVVKPLTYDFDKEKIEVEIREVVRIRAQDFSALKLSFEEWANKWNK